MKITLTESAAQTLTDHEKSMLLFMESPEGFHVYTFIAFSLGFLTPIFIALASFITLKIVAAVSADDGVGESS